MISLRMHHRQHGEKIFSVPEKAFQRIPAITSEEQKAAALARLMHLAPKLEAGWEFEIRAKEAV